MTDVVDPSLLLQPSNGKVVNVASVPKRSPFRYPGGKTWLVPHVRRWLNSLATLPGEFHEPFAGGGIISLTVAFERLAAHVTMVELDSQVAAVWHTILTDAGGAEWLAQRILTFEPTLGNVQALLAEPPASTREQAFQIIVKNRTFHGGILAPGSAPIKYGENGKGIASRWYASTLVRRIREIATVRHRITFIEGDAFSVMTAQGGQRHAAWFIDPPYTAAGKKAGSRLYTHFELDHNHLFDVAAALSGHFLMTYDNASEIRQMAQERGFDTKLVAMTNTHHATMSELLIGRDLKWVQQDWKNLPLFGGA